MSRSAVEAEQIWHIVPFIVINKHNHTSTYAHTHIYKDKQTYMNYLWHIS